MNSSLRPSLYCPVCSSNNIKNVAIYRFKNIIFSSRSIYSCNDCSLFFAFPPPAKVDLNLYNSSYFSNAHSGLISDKNVLAYHRAVARCRLACIQNYTAKHDINVNSIHEVGPGQGFLAALILKTNSKIDYSVTELDISCHASLESLGIHIIDKPEPNSSSLLILSHVLEHIPDPYNFLDEKLSVLSPGGFLFIEVPCLDFIHKKLDEPHLLFFQKESMLFLLESLGLVDINLSYHGRTINDLKARFSPEHSLNYLRSQLLRFGPFGQYLANVDKSIIVDPLEMSAALCLQPHIKHDKPSWWLRALARKPY